MNLQVIRHKEVDEIMEWVFGDESDSTQHSSGSED